MDNERTSLFMLEIQKIVRAAGKEEEFDNPDGVFSLTIENPPWFPLTIESFIDSSTGQHRVTVAHNKFDGKDEVPDPEVLMKRDGSPISLLFPGLYTEVVPTNTNRPKIRKSSLSRVNDYLTMWGTQLRAQNYSQAARFEAIRKQMVG